MEEVAETNEDQGSASSVRSPSPADLARVASDLSQRFATTASKIVAGHQRSNSFQRWRRQMQRAWKWGPSNWEQNPKVSFNPELMANQKRQWYKLHSRVSDHKQHKEPTSLFEQFFVVGLHSSANVDAIEEVFARRKRWESEMEKSELLDLRNLQYRGPPPPTLEPQILFKYPPRKRLAMRVSDIPSFCFPGGVKARVMERTPSMSDLNEVIYGQEHLSRDDLAFIFSLKVANNATLYGVCLHVQEIVQRLPGILGGVSPLCHSAGSSSQFLVAAPRCYCILTRVPFFELHYEMLNSIIAQERLERITQFVSEMTLTDSVPPGVTMPEDIDANSNNSNIDEVAIWMSSAIPVESVLSIPLSEANCMADNGRLVVSSRTLEPLSPESASTSEASEYSQTRDLEKDQKRNLFYIDDYASETTSGSRSDSFERLNGNLEIGLTSPEVGKHHYVSHSLERVESSESMLSSVRSAGSDDYEADEISSKFSANEVMEWAKEHKNDLLQIICSYHSLPLPPRGSETIFCPLEHLQPIKYSRPGLSALGLSDFTGQCGSLEMSEIKAKLAAAEEAFALSIWTTATVCRALSLESVLALFAAALLEKQVVIICSNLGILSATVLSVIPMIRPFEWQSLLLPVLPRKMIDFLDAPVPFIVGIQHKPSDLRLKVSNLIRINVNKDEVKMPSLPQLPRQRELVAQLGPIHARLSCENYIAKRHPVYKCSEVQAEAAGHFLTVMRSYLESLCSELRTHTITSVQSNNDKVSLLLKDSFVDSFPSRDKPFIKLFVETQLFSVLSDSRLSSYEHE